MLNSNLQMPPRAPRASREPRAPSASSSPISFSKVPLETLVYSDDNSTVDYEEITDVDREYRNEFVELIVGMDLNLSNISYFEKLIYTILVYLEMDRFNLRAVNAIYKLFSYVLSVNDMRKFKDLFKISDYYSNRDFTQILESIKLMESDESIAPPTYNSNSSMTLQEFFDLPEQTLNNLLHTYVENPKILMQDVRVYNFTDDNVTRLFSIMYSIHAYFELVGINANKSDLLKLSQRIKTLIENELKELCYTIIKEVNVKGSYTSTTINIVRTPRNTDSRVILKINRESQNTLIPNSRSNGGTGGTGGSGGLFSGVYPNLNGTQTVGGTSTTHTGNSFLGSSFTDISQTKPNIIQMDEFDMDAMNTLAELDRKGSELVKINESITRRTLTDKLPIPDIIQDSGRSTMRASTSSSQLNGFRRYTPQDRLTITENEIEFRQNPNARALTVQALFSDLLAEHSYILKREIGKGAFGETFICQTTQHSSDPLSVHAIYVMKIQKYGGNDIETTILEKLKSVCSEYYVCFHDYFTSGTYIDSKKKEIKYEFIVMEYLKNYMVMDRMEKTLRDDKILFTHVMNNVYHSIIKLNKMGIHHLDIKPSNIMMSEEGKVKLIDFGAGCYNEDTCIHRKSYTYTTIFVYPPYLYVLDKRKPMTNAILNKSDLWSLGAMMYFIICETSLRCMRIGKTDRELTSTELSEAVKYKFNEVDDDNYDKVIKYLEGLKLDFKIEDLLTIDAF